MTRNHQVDKETLNGSATSKFCYCLFIYSQGIKGYYHTITCTHYLDPLHHSKEKYFILINNKKLIHHVSLT